MASWMSYKYPSTCSSPKTPCSSHSVNDANIFPVDKARNLGIIPDIFLHPPLPTSNQFKNLAIFLLEVSLKYIYFLPCPITQLQIISCLGYGSSLITVLPASSLVLLESIIHSAARVVFQNVKMAMFTEDSSVTSSGIRIKPKVSNLVSNLLFSLADSNSPDFPLSNALLTLAPSTHAHS